MRLIRIILASTLAAPLGGVAQAQPPGATATATVAATETLTLERAVELALQQQPSVRLTRAQIEAANGRVDLANVARRPSVSVSASIGAASSRNNSLSMGVATGGGFFDPRLTTGLAASANWRIYDFGQTAINIRAAELNAQATGATLDTTILDLRTSVEVAYLEAVARGRLVQVAANTVKSEETHLDQAKKFVAAQVKDPIEVAQAQARAANARSALAQAQSSEAIALANLRAAIGWLDTTHTPTVTTEWPTPPIEEPPTLADLVENARKARPELRQLDLQIAASEANLDAALAERRPVLSASASTQWEPNTSDLTPEPTWVAGLTLSWQLFDGGKSKADARIARANVTVAQANRDNLLVNLTSTLDSARSQIVANRANVQSSNEAVAAARAQLQLADARYAQGLGSQIELADAQTAVTTAEGNLISAQWQLAEAWAQLHRAIGAR